MAGKVTIVRKKKRRKKEKMRLKREPEERKRTFPEAQDAIGAHSSSPPFGPTSEKAEKERECSPVTRVKESFNSLA